MSIIGFIIGILILSILTIIAVLINKNTGLFEEILEIIKVN